MAKRVRGSTSRPGQRPPLQRQASRSATSAAAPAAAAPAARPDELTDEEEAHAAQLEAEIVAEEKQTEAADRQARTARTAEPAQRSSSLELSASEEYGYVARDVRRIVIVGGGLVLVLLGLWVIAHFTGVLSF